MSLIPVNNLAYYLDKTTLLYNYKRRYQHSEITFNQVNSTIRSTQQSGQLNAKILEIQKLHSLEWIFLAYATSLIPSPFIEVPYRIRQMSGHAYVCQWYWF